jgi:hypothetical protein
VVCDEMDLIIVRNGIEMQVRIMVSEEKELKWDTEPKDQLVKTNDQKRGNL